MKTLIATLIGLLSVSAITALLLRSERRSARKPHFPAQGSRAEDTWQNSISLKSERDWQPPARNRDPALDRLMTEEQLVKVRAPQN